MAVPAVLAVCCLLVTACTPSSGETPSPSPTPVPSTTPRPTPTENAIERQERLDYEAAEKSYREFRAEYRRVLEAGGSATATGVMRRTATGQYLANTTKAIKAYEELGYSQSGEALTAYVRRGAHSPSRLLLIVCEDGRKVVTREKDGTVVGKNDLSRSEVNVTKVDGSWKLASAKSDVVTSCD